MNKHRQLRPSEKRMADAPLLEKIAKLEAENKELKLLSRQHQEADSHHKGMYEISSKKVLKLTEHIKELRAENNAFVSRGINQSQERRKLEETINQLEAEIKELKEKVESRWNQGKIR